MVTGREGEGGMNWGIRIDIHTLPCLKQRASGKLLSHKEHSLVLCDDLEGWEGAGGREAQQGGWKYIYIYIYMYIFVYIDICIYRYVYVDICIIDTCIIDICIYGYMCVCVCVYIYS